MAAPTPFLFGKLPAHGDFVARGLADPARAVWDDWGTSALGALRSASGDGFDEAHATAPPWRFVARSGPVWRAGALAPSVDGAGRRYLLALGAEGLSCDAAAGYGLALAGEAEGLIYEGLASGLTADALVALAADRLDLLVATTELAAATLAAAPAGEGVWWTLGSESCAPIALAAAAPPADLFARTATFAEPEFAR